MCTTPRVGLAFCSVHLRDTLHTRGGAERVAVKIVPSWRVSIVLKATNTRGYNIAEATLHCLVYTGGEAMEAKV